MLSISQAQVSTPVEKLYFSADIDNVILGQTGKLSSPDDAIIVYDELSGTSTSVNELGDLGGAEIDGFHHFDACGVSLYSLDSTKTVGNSTMRPADIFDASGGKELDAEFAGIPTGVNIDAISRDPSDCTLLFSIDHAAMLDGVAYMSDDIISYDMANGFELFYRLNFKSNIDALHVFNAQQAIISVETTTHFSDVDARDDDVVELFFSSQENRQIITFEPSTIDDSWQAADINALWAQTPGNSIVQFVNTSATFNENSGSQMIEVERVNGSSGAITVFWSTIETSAEAFVDYDQGTGSFSMADGQTTAFINMGILDDILLENLEEFTIVLDQVASGTGEIGINNQFTISIDDDPHGQVQWQTATAQVTEGEGSVTLTIERVNGSEGSIDINWSTFADTATAGDDFSPISGTVTMEHGVLSTEVVIDIVADDLNEGVETFNVTLDLVSGGVPVVGLGEVVVEINDNVAGVVQWAKASYDVLEGAGTAVMFIQRTVGTTGDLIINWSATDGSATFGNEYSTNSGAVILTDGQESVAVVVNIIDNEVIDLNNLEKTFSVSIDSVNNGALIGNLAETQVHILDDEEIVFRGGFD